jgi:RimJ/RimL family protein N-acetyltransferase
VKFIVETERLLLRELNINDAQSFYELNLNPNVIKYTGNSAFEDLNEAKRFLENYSDYQKNGFGRWAVINKSTQGFLGWCGLKHDEMLDETDIGFRFFEHFWNKGYATESAKACINYGFEKLDLETIIGRAMKENSASIKVLEKAGLQYKKDFDFGGKEGVIYSIKNIKNMQQKIVLKQIRTEDIETLQKIAKQTFFDTFSPYNTEENMAQYMAEGFTIDKLTAEIQNKNSIFFFALSGNEVIGYLKVNTGDAQTELKKADSLEIERIYVSKDFHGKKVGQILYDKALEIAREKNADYVWLGVWEENHRAVQFYKKNGFVEFDKHIFKFGNEDQTDIMMKKELK